MIKRSWYVLLAAAGVACGTDATWPGAKQARLRVINSVFEITDSTMGVASATPRAIDVFVDGSDSGVGVADVPPSTVGAGDAARYRATNVGVHRLFARLSGTTIDLYTTSTGQPYVASQYMTPFPYTLVVAGVVPAGGGLQPGALPFVLLVDDPFAPPQLNGAYESRFQVINAAPFADPSGQGASLSIVLTPGALPPDTLPDVPAATVGYQATSGYVNDAAGPYVITIATNGKVRLAEAALTLGAGEVRTFVLQSTAYSAAPSVANHRLTILIDATW